jgi:hypothetical protein
MRLRALVPLLLCAWSPCGDSSGRDEPVPISPTDAIEDRLPTFVWEPRPGAKAYRLEVKDAAGVAVIDQIYTKEEACSGRPCAVPSPVLLERERHTWRVQSLMRHPKDKDRGKSGDRGRAFWSAPRSFTPTEYDDGTPSDNARWCKSGNLSDGYCCNMPCDQPCAACDLAGREGQCSIVPAGTVCRAAIGECDATETCDGVRLACPEDVVSPQGTICRDSGESPERCTGRDGLCPIDLDVMSSSPASIPEGAFAKGGEGGECTCPAGYRLETGYRYVPWRLDNGERGDILLHKGGNPILAGIFRAIGGSGGAYTHIQLVGGPDEITHFNANVDVGTIQDHLDVFLCSTPDRVNYDYITHLPPGLQTLSMDQNVRPGGYGLNTATAIVAKPPGGNRGAAEAAYSAGGGLGGFYKLQEFSSSQYGWGGSTGAQCASFVYHAWNSAAPGTIVPQFYPNALRATASGYLYTAIVQMVLDAPLSGIQDFCVDKFELGRRLGNQVVLCFNNATAAGTPCYTTSDAWHSNPGLLGTGMTVSPNDVLAQYGPSEPARFSGGFATSSPVCVNEFDPSDEFIPDCLPTDNGRASVSIYPIVVPQTANVTVRFRLIDPESDPVESINVQFTAGNPPAPLWLPATLVGGQLTNLATAPDPGVEHTIVWDSAINGVGVAGADPNVAIMITGVDTGGREIIPGFSGTFSVNNTTTPVCGDCLCQFQHGEGSYNCPDDCDSPQASYCQVCGDGACYYPDEASCVDCTGTQSFVYVLTPAGQQTGTVSIAYWIEDGDSAMVSVNAEYSTDGYSWRPATGGPTNNLQTSTFAMRNMLALEWDTAADGVGTVAVDSVRFRIVPADGYTGTTQPFTVSNCGDTCCVPSCTECGWQPDGCGRQIYCGECGCDPCGGGTVCGYHVDPCQHGMDEQWVYCDCPGPCDNDGSCAPGVEDCFSCPGDCPCPMGTACGGTGQCLTVDVCGDGSCAPFVEGCGNCPGDCPCPAGEACNAAGVCAPSTAVCGDGTCTPFEENCVVCAPDCGCPGGESCDPSGVCTSGPSCGDGACNGGEHCGSCPADCGPCGGGCGDLSCEPVVEDCGNCPGDCPCPSASHCEAGMCVPDDPSVVCGDAFCTPVLEDCGNCPGDCPCWMPGTACFGGMCLTYCGNDICEPGIEDNCNCPGDCPPVCGNGTCDCEESCVDCPEECGSCSFCGDGTCDFGEDGCVCPFDCGFCLP